MAVSNERVKISINGMTLVDLSGDAWSMLVPGLNPVPGAVMCIEISDDIESFSMSRYFEGPGGDDADH